MLDLTEYYKEQIYRYNHFGRYLRSKYGYSMHKITIDAGFSCPNKFHDEFGKLVSKSCIYCNNKAFNLNVRRKIKKPVDQQIEEGIAHIQKRFELDKIIAYFQAYTNTYDSIDVLKRRYDIIRNYREIVSLAIGTRPDCIDTEKLDLIESYSDDYIVWVEYGLQSANDDTLRRISRGHNYQQFLDAIKMTESRNISICVHLILGLPGETHEDMMRTAEKLADLPINGIKLHNMCVVKDTDLEILYREGKYKPLTFEEYIQTATDFLERIPYNITVQRLTADSPPDIFVAPKWADNRWAIIDAISIEFWRRNSLQGILF